MMMDEKEKIINEEFGSDVDPKLIKQGFINFLNKLNPYDYLLLILIIILVVVMIWHTKEIAACNSYYNDILRNMTVQSPKDLYSLTPKGLI